MLKLAVLITVCTILLQTVVIAGDPGTKICEPQVIERISHEVMQQSVANKRAAALFSDRKDEEEGEKGGWVKRHPVIFGLIVGASGGAVIGIASGDSLLSDTNAFGRGLVLGGIGAPIGALVGKIASEY